MWRPIRTLTNNRSLDRRSGECSRPEERRRDLAKRRLDWNVLWAFLPDLKLACFAFPRLELSERFITGTLDPDFRRTVARESTRGMRRVVDHVADFGMQFAGRRSLDDLLMWARTPPKWCGRRVDCCGRPARPSQRSGGSAFNCDDEYGVDGPRVGAGGLKDIREDLGLMTERHAFRQGRAYH